MKNKIEGITLPFETCDEIAVACLTFQCKILKKDLKNNIEKGTYMHPEDIMNNKRYIEAMEVVIDYYGGNLK
jgi:hypothetical protein